MSADVSAGSFSLYIASAKTARRLRLLSQNGT